jgi:hypothetical protein
LTGIAREAYDMVYGGSRRPHHEITHELLAEAAAFEARTPWTEPRAPA